MSLPAERLSGPHVNFLEKFTENTASIFGRLKHKRKGGA